MKIEVYRCDECEKEFRESPPITLLGKWATKKAGILLSRYEFHFCSKNCIFRWVDNSKLS